MKKIFTLVAMATAALAVNAQSQMGNFKEGASTLDEATSNDPVTLVTTANVEAGFPFRDDENSAGKGYKKGHIKCDNESFVVITDSDGKKWIVDGNGATGNGNPRTEPTGATSITSAYEYTTPQRGVVYQFAINDKLAYDAYATLCVVGKFGNNKNYLVYENGNAIAYTLVIASKDFVSGASAQANYVIDEEKMKYPITTVRVDPSDSKSAVDHYETATTPGTITGGVLGAGTACCTIDQYYNFVNSAGGKNGVGVIYFPVVKGRTYQVCGLGTKLTASGFVLLCDDDPMQVELVRAQAEAASSFDANFVTADTQLESIYLIKNYEPNLVGGYEAYQTTLEECEGGATAVQGVAEAKAEVAAPVKVVKNGQIFIGNYTVAGAQVK